MKYQVRYASSPKDVKKYNTERLREEFLIQNIMEEDEINLVYSHYDRYISGSVVPVSKKVELLPIDSLKASSFLERRELGVINVGGKGTVSVNGKQYETVSAYASAKGGLKMLTKNMATEWAKYNIQTNGIGPGYFATSQTAPLRVDGHPFNEFIIHRTPVAPWGNPEDLAGTAVFLASKSSDFVNGQIIYVDGGILATIGKPSNEN